MGTPSGTAAPIVLLTCGDPAGIGPEVAGRAWSQPAAHRRARLRIVADAGLLAALHDGGRFPAAPITCVAPEDPRPSSPDEVLVIGSGVAAAAAGGRESEAVVPPPVGVMSAAGGRSAALAVVKAAALVRAGRAAALVTGPVHKEALHAAGYAVPGHTELLARECGLPDDAASMMLWLPAKPPDPASRGGADGRGGLGVVHATLHEPLRQALARLSAPLIASAGRRLAAALAGLLDRPPTIAVAALNPHAGEAGLFGDEERRLIAPAVAALTADGIAACGPVPADTLFLRAALGEYDGIVALYHDQGHIPVKLLGMHRAVNVTLGLPLVRTSVAHGTAFDIAGTGRADASGMLAAIAAAVDLVAAGWPLRAAAAPAVSRIPR